MSTWTPPTHLCTPIPRKVGMSETWKGFLLVPIIFFVPLAMILIFFAAGSRSTTELRKNGSEISAIITKLYVGHHSGRTSFNVYYTYQPKELSRQPDSTASGQNAISELEYKPLKPGDLIAVIYDPKNPYRSSLRSELYADHSVSILSMPIFALSLLVIIPAVSWILLATTYKREKHLLAFGQPVEAQIVDDTEYTVRNRRYSKLTYSFTDSDGNVIFGKRKGVPTEDDEADKIVGRRARLVANPTAIFDPQKSDRNLLYPPSAAKLL